MPTPHVKSRVLATLAAQPGQFFSGQSLAEHLGVSRAAVWKAIEALRAEGIGVEAAPNRGYALSPQADVLTADAVAARDLLAALQVSVVDEAESTNAAVRARAADGAPEGLVLIAKAQTQGRGRLGRTFYSPAGTGLYLSVLLRPALAAPQAPLLTALAAVAAAEAAEDLCGQPVRIKWVNDLLCGGKKVCGILTEAAMSLESGGLDYVVLGAGFNLAAPAGGWPPELAQTAGALFAAPPPAGARAALAAAFLQRFWALYQGFDKAAFLPQYRRRQAVLGRRVEVLAPGAPPRAATALAIDDDCRLVVRFADDGATAALPGGEVRVRPDPTIKKEN